MSGWYFTEEAKTGQNRPDLSANQERALTALLTHGTIEAAAESCNLGKRTIRRYLTEDAFVRAYRHARDRIIEGTVARAGSLAIEALDIQAEVMRDGEADPRVRLQASRAILDTHLKSVEAERKLREAEELEQRIQALEAAQGNGHGAW